ncbi:M56 family metallopeptidase [uncultured Kordia sp.]|uniref:M56 family metallopeptidase n=1 Tax=uncultured Kordia sp. TaxID=507699 RepID=UPI00261A3126|nr:M56 family metallopeptidase [uncultured Kordia sp.]
MLLYILKFSAILAILLAFYKLFLEKETAHVFKRYYLLASLVLAFGIPCITFTTYVETIVTTTAIPVNFAVAEVPLHNSLEVTNVNYWNVIAWSVYSIGLLLFGSKFIRNLWSMIVKVQQNPKHSNKDVTYVLMNEKVTPHTFLKYIFFNKQTFEQQHIPKEVVWHEETHAKQRHSIDIILVEALQVVLWFNPLLYIAKTSIKLNHEFLADQGVLYKGVQPSIYQEILLSFSSRSTVGSLANAINHSSIKKRFTIMKSYTSKRALLLRSLLLIPVVAFTLYSFSSRETILQEKEGKEQAIKHIEPIQKTAIKQTHTVKTTTKKGKVTPSSYFEGVRFVRYKNGIQYKDTIVGEHPIFDKKYEEFTEAEKNSKELRFMFFMPKPMEKRTPSNAELKKYLNKKVYAIWIDGESVDNAELANYKRTDFASYSAPMTITKTGRSEKYPQPFWCMFYTHDYYKAKKYGEQQQKYVGTEAMSFENIKKVNRKFKQ